MKLLLFIFFGLHFAFYYFIINLHDFLLPTSMYVTIIFLILYSLLNDSLVNAFKLPTPLRAISARREVRLPTKQISNFRSCTVFQSTSTSNDNITTIFRVIASISFIISILGLSFQVFVLYPWHEELSYEFKTLEQAIIRLDGILETASPTLKEGELKRLTDKYTIRPNG